VFLSTLLTEATDASQRWLAMRALIAGRGILEKIPDRFTTLCQAFQFIKPNRHLGVEGLEVTQY
jgi:hypothetical protein